MRCVSTLPVVNVAGCSHDEGNVGAAVIWIFLREQTMVPQRIPIVAGDEKPSVLQLTGCGNPIDDRAEHVVNRFHCSQSGQIKEFQILFLRLSQWSALHDT